MKINFNPSFILNKLSPATVVQNSAYLTSPLKFRGSEYDSFEKSTPQQTTIDRLYSPECKTEQGMNEDGYYETTIIDKQTNKPVKAYINKAIEKENQEIWKIKVKSDDAIYPYGYIGHIKFNNDIKDTLFIERMDSMENEKYTGVGTRLHQLAIERAIELGYNNIKLCSEYDAIPFHEKCGFKKIAKAGNLTEMKLSGQDFDCWKERIKQQPIL